MNVTYSSIGKTQLVALILLSGILAFSFSMVFSSCGITLFSSNCSGVNVSCRIGSPTVLSPNATAQAKAVATMQTIMKSKPLLSDPLSSQDHNNWGVDDICSFHDRAYFLTVGNYSGTDSCDSTQGRFSDVAIQINVTLYSGDSAAGLIFRTTPDQNEYYTFLINDTQFSVALFGRDDTKTDIIPFTNSRVIHSLGEENTLFVITKGNDFRLFINGKFVAEGYDSTLTTGNVGVALSHASSAKARFSHLIVYPV